MKKSILIISVAILFLATSCFTTANRQKTISVSGSGSVALKADIVSFQINVSEEAATTALAQQMTNQKISKILAILRQFNIEDKDITTTALNFSTNYYWEDNRQVKSGETVSQSVYVKMRDLDSFAKLVDELGSKVNGISFYSVNFDKEDKSEATVQSRELAYQDALEKATTYAQKAGLKIVAPISITDGYTSVSTRSTANGKMYAVEAAAAMDYGTEAPTGTLTVTTNTDVVFEIR